MFNYMKVTIRINEDLLKRAKDKAADQGRTLSSLIEEGLTLVLTEPEKKTRKRLELPVSKAKGGVQPEIDLNNSSDLEDVMNRCNPH